MTRATRQLTLLVAILAAYIPLITNSVTLPSSVGAKVQSEILPVLPLWAIVSLGSYMLGSIGWHLLIFNNAPAAQKKLEGEIKQANEELKARGVSVD